MPSLERLLVTGSVPNWSRAGFSVEHDNRIAVGAVVVELVDPIDGRTGVIGASFDRLLCDDSLDGLPLLSADPSRPGEQVSSEHPNGVTRLDHLVIMSPDLDRTADEFAGAGFELRRRREAERDGRQVHQLFYWAGDTIIEVVLDRSAEPSSPSRFWGLALTVEDLDTTVELLDGLVNEPRPAVQPGRRIASVRRGAGLSLPVAFMTPHR